MKILRQTLLTALMLPLAVSASPSGNETGTKRTRRIDRPLIVTAKPFGPGQAEVDAAKQRAERSDAVRELLKGSSYRLLALEFLNSPEDPPSSPSTRFRVVFYNYSKDVAVVAGGDFAGKEEIVALEEQYDPGVSGEEIAAAYEIAKLDPVLASLNAGGKLEMYEAMPPVSNLDGERLVNIGVRMPDNSQNQIVGISFKNRAVVRYENNAPPTARATSASCGIPGSQGSTGQGLAGTYTLTVNDGTAPLWEMIVVRPSASSGGEGSGIEIRDVKYRGKSVLKRGHAPVLNVQYVSSCGPYRDWQYAEGFFQAPATGANDVGPGFRILAPGQIATTAVETRNDTGNFQGIAAYQQDNGFGPELVLVTEMNAGWYRYIMEWRFAQDGRIRPRYGFGSVSSSCVCIQRNHHVYWRFDFDVVGSTNKIFQVERGRKFLTPVTNEKAVFRNYQRNRGFLIQNSNGDEAYSIFPNLTDGSVTDANGNLTDTFGGGDFWLLRYQGTPSSPGELNDPNSGAAINLTPWLNNESLVDQDVVVWYGAHQTRVDDTSLNPTNNIIAGSHVIGPDIRAVRW